MNNKHDGVQYIISTVVQELLNHPDRRFSYAETGYFWRWWVHQTDQTKKQVQTLVNNGTLKSFSNYHLPHYIHSPIFPCHWQTHYVPVVASVNLSSYVSIANLQANLSSLAAAGHRTTKERPTMWTPSIKCHWDWAFSMSCLANAAGPRQHGNSTPSGTVASKRRFLVR